MKMRRGSRPLVVMYHAFAVRPRPDPYHLFVTVQQLRQQLGLLRRLRYAPLDLDGFLAAEAGESRGRSVLVTIDDGYRSVVELALPVLAEYGFPAVLFVPPGKLGATVGVPEPVLSAEELVRAVDTFDVEIGAHGFDHTPLGAMTGEDLAHQTAGARAELAAMLGRAPRAFSYPNGSFGPETMAAVEKAGYLTAFAVHDDGGPMARSRLGVYGRDGLASLGVKALLSGPGMEGARRRAHVIRRKCRLTPPAPPPVDLRAERWEAQSARGGA